MKPVRLATQSSGGSTPNNKQCGKIPLLANKMSGRNGMRSCLDGFLVLNIGFALCPLG
jgi:hypothetical protein